MLKDVLLAIETKKGPVHLSELSRYLDIEKQALAGMVDFWVIKGRVMRDEHGGSVCAAPAVNCVQNCSCGGPAGCPFIN